MNIITSQRLIIRNTKLEDLESLYTDIFSEEDVVKYTFGKELFNKKQTEEFIIQNCNFENQLGLSTIIERNSEEIIGLGGIIKCEYLEQEDYEFGFILAKKFWGKGYASEIGLAQINFAKENLKAKRILALAHEDNLASIKCIKKLGLEYVSTVPTEGRGHREVFKLDF